MDFFFTKPFLKVLLLSITLVLGLLLLFSRVTDREAKRLMYFNSCVGDITQSQAPVIETCLIELALSCDEKLSLDKCLAENSRVMLKHASLLSKKLAGESIDNKILVNDAIRDHKKNTTKCTTLSNKKSISECNNTNDSALLMYLVKLN